MHGSWTHLISNMFGLLIFGTICEKKIGSNEFLLFYILCGIVCGAFSLVLYILAGIWGVVLVGASGAVYSVLLLFSVIFPTSRVFIFGIVPVPAPLLVLIYAGISIFDELFGRNLPVRPLGIQTAAHKPMPYEGLAPASPIQETGCIPAWKQTASAAPALLPCQNGIW